MRFLLDENMAPRTAQRLSEAGHDAVHARDVGLTSAPDSAVLEAARRSGRILITLDSDFGALVAAGRAPAPSVVFFRGAVARQADRQVGLLLANLDAVADDLQAGAVVVLGDERVRVRRLPVAPEP